MIRVLSGAVMVAVAVAAVWLAPPLVFLAVAEVLVVLGVSEYLRLAPAATHAAPAAIIGAAAVVCSAALATAGPASPAAAVVVLMALVGLGTVALGRWAGGSDAAGAVAAAVFPVLYVGLPVGALVAIRTTYGAAGLFLLMLTVMISDTAQYYAGRALGRRPLAATISPKKTVEGALGGAVLAPVAFALLAAAWLPQPAWSLPVRWGLGLLIVGAGIAGDLFESMLKRSAGVKDSAALIPGHGGVLDRIDALLFAAPVYLAALTYL